MPYQPVPGVDIFYEDIGAGAPVLFLHSGYSRGIVAFCGQIQPFFHRYRCLLPDFRGHGRSRGGAEDWDTPRLAEDMAAFLDALHIPAAHLIGYSLGGGVALHMAAAYPQRVRSLVTIGTSGVADPAGADAYEPEALLANGEAALIARMQAMHAEANGENWQRFMRLSARDWRAYPSLKPADWARLTMPMLLIAGEADTFATPARLAALQGRCPQAEVLIVPGAGHRPHMPSEQVQAVNARMLAFLACVG